MPRRNIRLLILLTIICAACHLRADRYGQIFSFAMTQVDGRSLKEVGREQLFEGALRGMMGPLKDKHSIYINPDRYPQLRQLLDQEFGGVGIEIILDPETNQLTVSMPLYGGPAIEAGVRPRDKILRIDGKPTQGMNLDDAAMMLKGKIGTPVVVTVQHVGEDSPVEIPIVRGSVQVDSVVGDRRNPDGSWNFFLEGHDRIGYIRVQSFGERTADEMDRAVAAIAAGNPKGLVIDLRSNPGGLLPAAVRICDVFLDEGTIVTTRDREDRVRQAFDATPGQVLEGVPVAVIVNRLSASASEIVAACLQDHGRAIVVGERTYGKGTIQELIELPGQEGVIKLTTASYWRPSGKDINRPNGNQDDEDDEAPRDDAPGQWGVSPNEGFQVKVEGQALDRYLRWQREFGVYRISGSRPPALPKAGNPPSLLDVDLPLKKAVEHLEQP